MVRRSAACRLARLALLAVPALPALLALPAVLVVPASGCGGQPAGEPASASGEPDRGEPDRGEPGGRLVPGGRAARPGEAPRQPGNWHVLAPDAAADERFERLRSLGYAAAGSTPAGARRRGVVEYDPARAWPGLNFYVSGDAPEARLVDMEGRLVHRWRLAFADVWPDHPAARGSRWKTAHYWRRAWLLPGGDVLAMFAGLGLVRVGPDSRPVWASPVEAHHDLDLLPDGRIWVLTREARIVPQVDPREPVLEDFLSLLSPDGRELSRISLLECLERSPWAGAWRQRDAGPGYVLHANTVEVLDGRLSDRVPEFRAGRLLTSFRALDMIAVVDPGERRVVWAWQGDFAGQHDPQVLAGGGLLLFDNYGAGERSRILELDPAGRRVAWSYDGSGPDPFYSRYNGAVSRLPNGNTLIVESNTGRAFEITPGGETVWEFLSPHVAGDDGGFVATLFDLTRVPPEAAAWTRDPGGPAVGPGD